MKTERNGILETTWRKITNFMETPYFWLICSLLCFALTCLWGICSLGFFGEILELLPADSAYSFFNFIEYPLALGVYLTFTFFAFLNLIFSIRDLRKSSAEADKNNKNENKE